MSFSSTPTYRTLTCCKIWVRSKLSSIQNAFKIPTYKKRNSGQKLVNSISHQVWMSRIDCNYFPIFSTSFDNFPMPAMLENNGLRTKPPFALKPRQLGCLQVYSSLLGGMRFFTISSIHMSVGSNLSQSSFSSPIAVNTPSLRLSFLPARREAESLSWVNISMLSYVFGYVTHSVGQYFFWNVCYISGIVLRTLDLAMNQRD